EDLPGVELAQGFQMLVRDARERAGEDVVVTSVLRRLQRLDVKLQQRAGEDGRRLPEADAPEELALPLPHVQGHRRPGGPILRGPAVRRTDPGQEPAVVMDGQHLPLVLDLPRPEPEKFASPALPLKHGAIRRCRPSPWCSEMAGTLPPSAQPRGNERRGGK